MDSYFRYHKYPGSPTAGAATISGPETGRVNSTGDQALPRVPRAPCVDELLVSSPGVDPSSLCRCTVCRKVFRDPVICKGCEDSFCEGCLERHCRDSEDCGGQRFEAVVRNGHLRKVVLGLRVHCPHTMVFNHAADKWEVDGAGCSYVGSGTEVQAHQRICGYRLASCPRCRSIFTKRDRSRHIAECRIRCQLCNMLIHYRDLVPHFQDVCPEVASCCPSNRCPFLGSRREVAEHTQRCALLLPSQRTPPNLGAGSNPGESVRRVIQVCKTRLPEERSTGLDAHLPTSKAASNVQTPLQKPVTVTRDPLSFHRNVPEAPGTPPSETNTPSTSAAATARTPGPSTGHGSEGNIARNGRLVIEQTEEGGAGRGEAGPSDERGSETETEEVKGDSEDTSAESEDRGEGANTGQSRAEEFSTSVEASLHDLCYHPDSWVTLDQSLGGQGEKEKRLLFALEGLIKQSDPEKLRVSLLETGSQVDRSALVPLRSPTLRLLYLILTGKSDIRSKQVPVDILLGEIFDAFGIIVVSSDIKGGGSKRRRDSEEEPSKKHLKSAYGANSSPAAHSPYASTSRQRQLERNRIIKRILERLEKAECAQDFREPVSEKVAPGYSKIISRPMSLSTIFNKVAGSDYTVSTLRDDMELIRQNAHTFCKDSYPAIVARADQLMHLFNAELEMERGELASVGGLRSKKRVGVCWENLVDVRV